MNIICIDPSLTCTGYTVVNVDGDKNTMQECGVIKTERDKKEHYLSRDKIHRFQKIYRKLKDLHNTYQYKALCAELPSGTKSEAPAIAFGGLYGILGCIVEELELVPVWHTPRQVKKAMTGKGNASKEDMVKAASAVFPDSISEFENPSPRAKYRALGKGLVAAYADVADSIGVFTASKTREEFKMIKLMSREAE